jgi:hypothetical protein
MSPRNQLLGWKRRPYGIEIKGQGSTPVYFSDQIELVGFLLSNHGMLIN